METEDGLRKQRDSAVRRMIIVVVVVAILATLAITVATLLLQPPTI